MPPKGYRKSMPGRLNSTMLTPSRRSPRVPVPKSANDSPQSSKSLDLSSTDPPDSSFNIRFYKPKTPSKSSPADLRHENASPDVPLSRRRTFQARPSRLSTVYTPAVETPNSNTSSRRTRRSAALETPQNQFSDDDFAETGWTLEQYLGLGNEEDMAGQTSPTNSSSLGTRTSSRLRRPTERLIESQESKQKLRKKATLPAPLQKQVPQRVQKGQQKAQQKTAMKIVKTKPIDKGKAVQKETELLRIKTETREAALALCQLASNALSDDFKIADDPEKLIADAREYLQQLEAGNAQDGLGDEAETPEADGVTGSKPVKAVKPAKPVKPVKAAKPVESVKTAKPAKPAKPVKSAKPAKPVQTKIVLKFKKSTPPNIDTDGWVKTGRVNDSGEELVLTPTDHSPYRSPHTYGDDALPSPPVRSRSAQQVEDDTALGFPPLIGDRNVPFDGEVQFTEEDVAEEKARVKEKTSSKTSSKAATKASSKTSMKTSGKTSGKTSTKTSTKTSAETSAKASSAVPAKPVVQRLTLKLKPAPKETQPASDDSSDETTETTATKNIKKQSAVAKGKKRKADLISGAEEPKKSVSKKPVTGKSSPAKTTKTADPAPAAEPSTKLTISTGRGRSASRAAPGAVRGTPAVRGTRGPRGPRVSRGGRVRGAGTGTGTGTGTGSPGRGGRGQVRGSRGPGRGRGRGRSRAV